MSKKPRVQVSLDPSDFEIIELLSERDKLSKSEVMNKIVHVWLEEYEDFLLAKMAEEAHNEWVKDGCKTITHEEMWKALNI